MNYKELSDVFKILSNDKRLEILDLLSCGELCACEIQKKFNVTQPTLSYDMKLLKEASLIIERIDGRTHYYNLNQEYFEKIRNIFNKLSTEKANCCCHR
ncbi:MAG: metalloregulator ArsR/SmtB family transcription factor [Sphaerochaetaceae bacterium]|jgi:ArsR family transcriptional regulator|nr:metalloregulator ArsR/SmtB family transcription factor [Sphaerochaetaceae bacterium]MDC7238106.1 metalloregulator ArsR/SmtB family transcription factor [Sphaerochaetaceae bacterium]MDC7249947.1 metalloregulator ArsR/SmtB family transcription factor [Sphaerochaetaceae bacterium]